ncbi:MAG TPA: prolyl oligopeptidase family serine peptidase, partial [Chthonomonadales bacterium]|nr:prolyl oligopeptidase family serine peptidase [Chthonomonadales bacterium]
MAAGKDGGFSSPSLRGGYAFASVPSSRAQVMILEASGDSLVYVNGEIRAGDPYGYGYVHLPVALRKGNNDLLFAVGGGSFHARLVSPTGPIVPDSADTTLPDAVRNEPLNYWGAIPVLNCTPGAAAGYFIETYGPGLRRQKVALPRLIPLSVRKVGFRLAGPPPAGKEVSATIRIVGPGYASPAVTISIPVREHGQDVKRTFVSAIDGSVQYYTVVPAHPIPGAAAPPALVLTLHGAGVESKGQADAYGAKSWADIVAPTNRRPYGFDWEDWGRMDAIEVLNLAQRTLHTDPARTYLTGHSMGGHGTWQVGVTYPGRFAAIGPSAGWISFQTYIGSRAAPSPTPMEAILSRAAGSSDTLAMAHNYSSEGVYILHGGADDNVPVTEARHMKTYLTSFDKQVKYHEQPGAGHWWGTDLSKYGPGWGTACVDWPPMFQMFQGLTIPADKTVDHIDFTTMNPGVSAVDHWITVCEQRKPLEPSRVIAD